MWCVCVTLSKAADTTVTKVRCEVCGVTMQVASSLQVPDEVPWSLVKKYWWSCEEFTL